MKKIQIISSSNCRNCELLYEVVNTIVKKKEIDAQVEKILDVKELVKYGVMTTPILVVNGELKHVGTPIPAPQEIEKMITE